MLDEALPGGGRRLSMSPSYGVVQVSVAAPHRPATAATARPFAAAGDRSRETRRGRQSHQIAPAPALQATARPIPPTRARPDASRLPLAPHRGRTRAAGRRSTASTPEAASRRYRRRGGHRPRSSRPPRVPFDLRSARCAHNASPHTRGYAARAPTPAVAGTTTSAAGTPRLARAPVARA